MSDLIVNPDRREVLGVVLPWAIQIAVLLTNIQESFFRPLVNVFRFVRPVYRYLVVLQRQLRLSRLLVRISPEIESSDGRVTTLYRLCELLDGLVELFRFQRLLCSLHDIRCLLCKRQQRNHQHDGK